MKALVIFVFRTRTDMGIQSAVVEFEHYPPTVSDLCDITEKLKEHHKSYNDIAVVNWKRLSEEE